MARLTARPLPRQDAKKDEEKPKHENMHHFAYPPRKSSDPPRYRSRAFNIPFLRRLRLRTAVLLLLTFLGGWYLLLGSRKADPYHEHVPSGKPPVVIVTVVDTKIYSTEYLNTVQENRKAYAEKHGYSTFIVPMQDYDTGGYPRSWSKIMAMRHALTQFPDCQYLWFLDQNGFIMEPSKTLEEQVLQPRTLEDLMIRDYPVVPPDSIIKTFKFLQAQNVGLIVSQDNDGLVADSIVIKNGDWAKFFTETWLDPLYRNYNFQKAERHALEHMVQWHPTILSKIALVPQRTMASYAHANLGQGYKEGDFVVLLRGCTTKSANNCEQESKWYWNRFQERLAEG